jgi:hypothetical protein
MRILKLTLAVVVALFMTVSAQHKFVGVKMCAPCHKGEKKGSQFEIWQKSSHAKAFETLKSTAAEKIKKGAAEDAACLGCHTVGDAKLNADGVACEACHGAGSDYKSMATMKDKAKAIAAGLADLKDKAAIEKACKECHNAKSPTFKGFKFDEMWAKVKHPAAKG